MYTGGVKVQDPTRTSNRLGRGPNVKEVPIIGQANMDELVGATGASKFLATHLSKVVKQVWMAVLSHGVVARTFGSPVAGCCCC